MKPGEIGLGLIMEAGWNSTSYAGCEFSLLVSCEGDRLFLLFCRLCLDRLGVFEESDNKALVLQVFWKYGSSFFKRLNFLRLM
jgi:hypothetical protein